MRKPIIAGNWKMHKTGKEGAMMVQELAFLVKDVNDVEIVVCPPFTALEKTKEAFTGTNIKLGAQNMHFEDTGAFTGEISPVMLQDIGCDYVIIGHSERREYFAETNESVNKKIKAAFAKNIIPIVCIGETLAERESGITEKVIEKQVREGFEALTLDQISNIVIAYEPIWAIGTGLTASADDANNVCKFIRNLLAEIFSLESAEKARIQYGGSVKSGNISELMAKSDIDGALVGGASLLADEFSKIVNFKS